MAASAATLPVLAFTFTDVAPPPSITLSGSTDNAIAIPSLLPMLRLVPVTVWGELLPEIETDSSPS